MNRRRFLTVAGAGTLAGAGVVGLSAAGCGRIRKFLQVSNAPAARVAARGTTTTAYTVCDNCVNKCGIIAHVARGRIVKIEPNPAFPKSRGMLCAKGNAGVKVIYDRDRLKHPLIRVGERGGGQWRKASWDEALDATARGLMRVREQYGPQGVLFSSCESFQERFFRSFAQAWGSPNLVRHPSMCLGSSNLAWFITYGTVPEFDLAHAEYVIVSGANRLESFVTPDSVDLVDAVARRKATLVYLDPRFTVTASKADVWLPIRPGTDLAFYLALINVLVTEQLYDREFVATYTQGFDELVPHVAPYTPEWAARETEIPAERIRSVAREFAARAPRAVIYRGRRTSWYRNDTELRQAMAIANVLVGNWDVQGGVVPNEKLDLGAPEPPEYPWPDAERVDGIVQHHPLASADDGAYLELREAVLADRPYPVRGWMFYKHNPLQALPDRARTERMIRKMDFVVAIDIQPSDAAWLADVVLPESTYLERTDPVEEFSAPYAFAALRAQVVPPAFSTRSCLDIMKGLAARVGLGQYFSYDIDSYIAAQLAPRGVDRSVFARNGVWAPRASRAYGTTRQPEFRFRTPSGKIEIANERLRRNGYAPLPGYTPPAAAPQGQFRFLTGKQALFTHASNQNNEWLHELCPENRLWMNRAEAGRRGIEDGDMVRVTSPVGSVEVRAFVTDRIRPDCVHLAHGFGHKVPWLHNASGRGASDQDLIEPRWDRISGNAALHETFVTVERV
jgi:thiosulfate reductase/polysulfide reductase chain A